MSAVFHETVADGSIIPPELWSEAYLAIYPHLWNDDETEVSHEEILSVLIEHYRKTARNPLRGDKSNPFADVGGSIAKEREHLSAHAIRPSHPFTKLAHAKSA
jgi:hypothetical protein